MPTRLNGPMVQEPLLPAARSRWFLAVSVSSPTQNRVGGMPRFSLAALRISQRPGLRRGKSSANPGGRLFSGVMMVLSRSWLRCSWASRTASTRAAPGSATASRAVAVAAASARQATAAMARRGRQGRARRLTSDASDDVEIHVLVDRHRLERVLVQRDPQDRVLLLRREAPGEVGAELGLQQRNAFLAPALVPDGVFAHDLVELPAVREL